MTRKVHYTTPQEQEYFFNEGCYILEICNDTTQPDLSIARARVKPGVETRLHKLKNTVERYVIISGQGIATINGVEYHIKENDVVLIGRDVFTKSAQYRRK